MTAIGVKQRSVEFVKLFMSNEHLIILIDGQFVQMHFTQIYLFVDFSL